MTSISDGKHFKKRFRWKITAGVFVAFFCILLLHSSRYPWRVEFVLDAITKNNSTLYELNLSISKIPERIASPSTQNMTDYPSIPQIQIQNQIQQSVFANILSTFDWEGLGSAGTSKNAEQGIQEIEKRQEGLLSLITPYLEMEPLVEINESCTPILTPANKIKCQGHGNVFTGQRRSKPPMIGILVQFGFGVDVLEIYLNEVYEIVDRFFILESTRSHFRTTKKPLLWERIKHQSRFQKFADKVVHFVVDDAATAKSTNGFQTNLNMESTFELEALQEQLRWSKFLEWNEAHNFFNNDDLLGIGDADEIPNIEMLHMVRHCQLNTDRFDMGIWFSFGNINYAFKTDFPVGENPYTLGDPTFWTLGSAKQYGQGNESPSRMRGASGKYLLGGIHMTHSGYLPFQIARRMSCTECRPFTTSEIEYIAENLRGENLRNIELTLAAVPHDLTSRNEYLSDVANKLEGVAILPWFYACNKNRYPSWEGNHDTRLD